MAEFIAFIIGIVCGAIALVLWAGFDGYFVNHQEPDNHE